MPLNEFAPFVMRPGYGTFIVQNITTGKRIKIFNYPIAPGKQRDLLAIPGVGEADLRASLLKGEIRNKILAEEILVIASDIDLLQFNLTQKAFLQAAGITNGLDASGGGGVSIIPFLFKQNMSLSGTLDGVNRVFTTPNKFMQGNFFGNTFSIMLFHNGQELIPGTDFTTSESGGVGTGYDTITFTSFIPNANSVLVASYVISSY